jgi:chemosensory pili system protein ChpC
MCVAEVIAFAETERNQDVSAPDWLLGTINWNGRQLPVVSFDSDKNEDAPSVKHRKKGARSRVVVFHTIGSRFKRSHYGVLTQGFPQLVLVNRDVISVDEQNPLPVDQPILCRARMIHDYPLIPDLEALEDRLAELDENSANQ